MNWNELETGKLYIRTFEGQGIAAGGEQVTVPLEEMVAYSLKGFRRLQLTWAYFRPKTNDRDGYETFGGWEYCNPDAEIEGNLRPATPEDVVRYLDHWCGNGNPTTSTFSKDHVGEELAAKMWEQWAQRIDRYIDNDQDIPYAHKPAGYNYFRNKKNLWKMIAWGVLGRLGGIGDVRQVRPGGDLWENLERGIEVAVFSLELNYRWVLECQGTTYEKDQITQIIETAPPEVHAALRDLRNINEVRLSLGGDDLAKIANAQRMALQQTLVSRLANVLKKHYGV